MEELGPKSKIFIFILNILINLAIITVFTVLFAETMEDYICDEDTECASFFVFLLPPYIALLLSIIFVKHVLFFYIPATLTLLAYSVMLVSLYGVSIVAIIQGKYRESDPWSLDWSNVLNCVSGALYAHEGIMTIISTRSMMAKPRRYIKIFDYSFYFIFVVFVSMPLVVVLVNFSKTESIAYMNYNGITFVLVTIIVFLVLCLFFKPFYFYTVGFMIDEKVQAFHLIQNEKTRRVFIFSVKIVILILCYVLAGTVQSFSDFIEYIGYFLYPLAVLILPVRSPHLFQF